MAEKDGFGSFLIGFVVGGLAGAVVALLYAPASGEETRTVIKDKAIELKDKTVETFDETAKKVSETVQKGKVLLESQKEALKTKKAAS